MLAHYDVTKPLKLFCNAFLKGLGACLVHVMPDGEERLVVYASHSLSQAKQHYAQIEREVLAVQRFHQYLYGRDFTVVTDLWGKEGIPPLAATRMQRWALLFSAYQYKIQGTQNNLADLHVKTTKFVREG